MTDKEKSVGSWPIPDDVAIQMIGTWPTPEKNSILMIGTWPIPERVLLNALEAEEFFSKVAKPSDEIRKLAESLTVFNKWICKLLDKKIHEDIYVVCKYQNEGLCTDQMLVDALTRLSKSYPYYRRYCCRS